MDEEKIRRTYHDVSLIPMPELANGVDTGIEVVAGEDDRQDIHELGNIGDDALRRKLTEATVILTNKSRIADNGDETFALEVNPFRQRETQFSPPLPPCSGERFASQHTGGWCSGFLVGADVIVTAGHCGETEDEIKDTAYIFGFQVNSPTDAGTTQFNADQVYFGKELIAHDLSSSGDFAIVRLDRAVPASVADPLKVRVSGTPALNSNLGVIGYPSGLPVKIAFGSETKLLRDLDPWLISNLDTYGGNSGSPVFNTSGEVEGILVRGAKDYNFTNTCFRTNKIENEDGSEAITKASVFQSKIPI
ncbi:MAG: serine protease [Alphaproteobacteria bacterium]|nr:serine protease [Alphaproteobacteria bacterium]